MTDFLANLVDLSSTGLVGTIFEILEPAGKWAESAVKLAGLL